MFRIQVVTRVVLSVLLAIGLSALDLAAPSSRTASAAVNQVFLPNITKTLGGGDGWTTPIVVQNTGPTATDVTITLYRFSDGGLSATVKAPALKPGQSWSFDPRTNPALPNDMQFAAVVQAATGQIAATVIEGSRNSWMAYAGTTTGAATVYLPNITRNLGGRDGWNTPFIVQNIGTKAVTASVSFYAFSTGALARKIDNVQLQPGRSQAFTPAIIDGLIDDTQYAVVVQGPADAQLYAIVNEVSGGMAMSYEGLLGGSDVVYLPNVLKFLGGTDHWSTPFVVQNLGTTATTVSAEFYAFDTGRLIATIPAIGLQPGRSAPVDVRFNPSTLPQGSYSVVLRGQKGSLLGAVVNEIDPGAGMAMSYLGMGQAQAQPSAYLPLVQKNVAGAGWFSPIVAQNVSAAPADITLTLFDANGDVAMQKVFPAVRPGAAAVYDPRFDRRLKNGTYSGLVQSAANISAVVNVTGASSGDYAMAFTSTSAPQTAVPTFANLTKPVGTTQVTLHMGANVDVWIENSVDASTAARIATQSDADVTFVQDQAARPFTNIPVVYVFATDESYAGGLQSVLGYTELQAKTIASHSSALYQPARRIIVANWAAIGEFFPQSAIRHELTHAMNHQITRDSADVPTWLDEGLAFSSELAAPGAKWLAMESRYGTASMAATGTLFTLAQLSSPLEWSARSGAAGYYQYLEAAQAVAMLRADVGSAGITRILELLGQGQPFESAYQTVAGKPFSEFAAGLPARAKALAPTSPGVAAVDDSPIGPSVSWIAYGFSPLSLVSLEIRSSTQGGSYAEITSRYGTDFGYLGTNWSPGQYKITFSSVTTTVSTFVTKR